MKRGKGWGSGAEGRTCLLFPLDVETPMTFGLCNGMRAVPPDLINGSNEVLSSVVYSKNVPGVAKRM